ncbi:MAG: hypothetical protein ACKOTZ_05055 [Chloroflexota bacterium]
MHPFLPDAEKVAAMRALLPATGAGIYLDTASAGPVLAETDRALREADDHALRVGRGGPDHPADAAWRREEAAGVLAAVLGTDPAAVVPGRGLRALACAVHDALGRGPLAVHPGCDPAVVGALRARGGTVLATADGGALPDPARGATVVAPLVDARTGAAVGVAALADRVRAGGGRLVCDATLAAGVRPLVADTLGADALLLATDRWLLGPDGSAAAWLAPAHGPAARTMLAALADPLPRRDALGLARSAGWLLMYAGLPWVHARTQAAAARLHAALAGLPGVRLAAPEGPGGALVVLAIAGWDAEAAADALGQRVFAIVGRDADAGTIHAAAGAWTTDAEIDRFAAAVAELAAHTPETLPRRAPLVVFTEGSHG